MAIFPNGGGVIGGIGGSISSDDITDAGTTGKALIKSQTPDDGLTALDVSIASGADIISQTPRKLLDATAVVNDSSMAGYSDEKVPSEKAVVDYVANQSAGGVTYHGIIGSTIDFNSSTTGNAYIDGNASFKKGDMFVVTGDGNLVFADGTLAVTNGDAIIIGNDVSKPNVNKTDVGHVETSAVVTAVFGRTGAVTAENGDYTASQVTNVPAGDVSAVTVQAAIDELDAEKIAKALLTAKGSLISASASGTPVNVTIGTNDFVLSADSSTSSGLAWKAAVSSFKGRTGVVVPANGDYTATQITNTPSGAITATTVQAALNELDTEKTAKSILTTKGDLYVATAASTLARLPAGANGSILIADSTQSTGLRYQLSIGAYVYSVIYKLPSSLTGVTTNSVLDFTTLVSSIGVNPGLSNSSGTLTLPGGYSYELEGFCAHYSSAGNGGLAFRWVVGGTQQGIGGGSSTASATDANIGSSGPAKHKFTAASSITAYLTLTGWQTLNVYNGNSNIPYSYIEIKVYKA